MSNLWIRKHLFPSMCPSAANRRACTLQGQAAIHADTRATQR